MIISLFLKGKEFHVFWGNQEYIYTEKESRNLGDNIPSFIGGILKKQPISNLKQLIYSSGPASFTSARIINSVIKGFALSFPETKFIGISNFLTYYYLTNEADSELTIAIPTMRGDYFTAHVKDSKITEMTVASFSGEPTNNKIVFEDDPRFSGVNLARDQFDLLNTNLIIDNPAFVNTDLRINYGFTPQYSC